MAWRSFWVIRSTKWLVGRCLTFSTEQRTLTIGNLERRRGGYSEQLDVQLLHRDGQVVWTIMTTNPLLDASGQSPARWQ